MKKLKLFLLGSIICLFGFSFSNAWNVTYTFDKGQNLVGYIGKGLSCVPSPNLGLSYRCYQLAGCKGGSSEKSFWPKNNFNLDDMCQDSNYPYLCQLSVRTNNNITSFSCYGFTDKMPVSALTPAIDGLHNTLIELIPYILFLGIGVLLFTLGFYAIRRLVNWLSGKINSNFKSKC